MVEILFWIASGIVLYTYVGYGLILSFIGIFIKKKQWDLTGSISPVTIIIPAYNEGNILPKKIENTLKALSSFPQSEIIVITDGSNDGSERIAIADSRVRILHQPERRGKSAAINRAMEFVNSEIVFITDANAMVNESAFYKMALRFQNTKTGGVSGEKRVLYSDNNSSSGTEGIYWKYESFLKRKGAEFYTVVGAAGELFSFRKSLFKKLEEDAILDDFVLSVRIIEQGFQIDYEPQAYALEEPSKNINDEFERKVRISSGVWQTLSRMNFMFNPFFDFRFFFQFISHRFLRWTIAPLSMIIIFILTFFLMHQLLYLVLFYLQIIFYILALLGFLLKSKPVKFKAFYVPFYFCMMNFAVVAGLIKYLKGGHSVLWKKAGR